MKISVCFRAVPTLTISLVCALVVAGCWDFERTVKSYDYTPYPGINVGVDPTGERNLVEVVYLQQSGSSLHQLVHEVFVPDQGWIYDLNLANLSNSGTDSYSSAFSMASSTEKFMGLAHATLVGNDRTNGVTFYEWVPSGPDPALDGYWSILNSDYYTSNFAGATFLQIDLDVASGPLNQYGSSDLHAVVRRQEDGGDHLQYYYNGIFADTIEFAGNYSIALPKIVVNDEGTPFVAFQGIVNFGATNQWGGITVARRVAPGKWQRARLESGAKYPTSLEHDPKIAIDVNNPDKIHVAFYIGYQTDPELIDRIYYTTVDFSGATPTVITPYEVALAQVDWQSEMDFAIDQVTNEPIIVYEQGEVRKAPKAIRRQNGNWVSADPVIAVDNRAVAAQPIGGRDIAIAAGPFGEIFAYWRARVDIGDPSPNGTYVTNNILSWKNWVFLVDDFEDANYDGWTTSGGTWAITQNGTLRRNPASGDAGIYRNNPNPSSCPDPNYRNEEFVVQFDYKLNNANGLDVRLDEEVGGDSCYLQIRGASLELWKNINGTPARLAYGGGSSSVGTWYTIRAEMRLVDQTTDGVRVYRSSGGGGETLILQTSACPRIDSDLLTFVVKSNSDMELDNISAWSDDGIWRK
ncbi:MAG: hypothetical protein QM234_07500 [Acidobacteriota bacterium]|nr:hypothetical protein [Acidobacteriota bacterium]